MSIVNILCHAITSDALFSLTSNKNKISCKTAIESKCQFREHKLVDSHGEKHKNYNHCNEQRLTHLNLIY